MIFVVVFLGSFVTAIAQPIFNAPDFQTIPLGTDSCLISRAGSSLPVLMPDFGGVWDLAGIADSDVFPQTTHLPDADYHYADSVHLPIAGEQYGAALRLDINPVGIQEFGRGIAASSYSLFLQTAGLTDTLWIDGQFDRYSIPRTTLRFPANYGSNWISTYFSDLHLRVSLEMDAIVDMPGVVREYVVENRKVAGWGKMRVKDAQGHPSAFFDVLQISVVRSTIDSVLMQDTIRNPVMSLILRVPQGKRDTQYRQEFVMAGSLLPLAEAYFASATIITPYRITTLTRAGMNVVPDMGMPNASWLVYPNPCSAGGMLFGVPGSGVGQLGLDDALLLDQCGRSRKIALSIGGGGWHLPDHLEPGNYTFYPYGTVNAGVPITVLR